MQATAKPEGAEDFFFQYMKFYRGHAGATERSEARRLAEAEEWARSNGYEFSWTPHEEAWEYWLEGSGASPEDLSAVDELDMLNSDGDVVRSLCGIKFGLDEALADRDRRMFQAKMAQEQMG